MGKEIGSNREANDQQRKERVPDFQAYAYDLLKVGGDNTKEDGRVMRLQGKKSYKSMGKLQKLNSNL